MLARIYPDGSSNAEREEVTHIMRSVNNNNRGLLEEMMPSRRQEQRFALARASLPVHAAGCLNCSGPLVVQSIQIFGAKVGFALHYATTGRVVPQEGGVAVRWYSNFDAMMGEIPAKLFKILGPPLSLTQGKWSVEDQFSYAFCVVDGGRIAAYFSTFRRSFAVLSWVCENANNFDSNERIQIFRPAQFR